MEAFHTLFYFKMGINFRVDIVLSFGKKFSVYLKEGSRMTNHVSV